jgi:sulfatase modifying factor 1
VGGYWAQATKSDTLAGNTIGVAHSANYYDGDYVGYPGTALTNVGAYGLNSASAYGTNDQAGNVYEWNDAVIDRSWRGLRGGSLFGGEDLQTSSSRDIGSDPSDELAVSVLGFRVASIP